MPAGTVGNVISEETLRKLLALRAESKNLDYKQAMNWSSASNEEKCQFVKDVLAMMNTQDGGRIVIGVDDKTCYPHGVSDADAASFDITRVNDFVHKYADPSASCQVQKLACDGKNFIVIDVPEFQDVPIVCKADANSPDNKPILKRGGLYVRTDKASSELFSSADQMRELLGRALLKRGDHLLRTIRLLITGHPASEGTELERYQPELQAAEEFFSEVLSTEVQQRGHWGLAVMPSMYAKERVPDIRTVAQAVTASAVTLRGWTFPHVDEGNSQNFAQGRQSSTIWTDYNYSESFRAYLSGLFVWRATYWDDSPKVGGPRRDMSWVNIIFQITEFFIFISRYYARIAEDATLAVSIRLTDTGGRVLVSRGDAGPLFANYVCPEDEIEIIREYSVSELRASPEEAARPIIRRVFELFQWTGVRDDLIQQRQHQLIEKQV